MNRQIFNPYLPGYEYIPDGEPYIFDGRLYVYGSHDRFGAPMFCMNDYVCWSAPVSDLSDWKYEGVIFRKSQDPKNLLGLRLLFAPDVVQGADGRYYLYYALDFIGIMGVAVCDTPNGSFRFLGHVRHADGRLWGRKKGDSFPFDPGVLTDDDGRIYLYSGFSHPVPAVMTGFRRLQSGGGYVLELEQDMVTIREPEKLLFPKSGEGAFFGHEFFEASSIRKYDGLYYFVYSSRHNHELCYAVSEKPTEGFRFGGTLVSNGDLFLEDNRDENRASNYIGNNHGGMLKLDGQYYIFYHRHTNRHSYSRQACAEALQKNEDGSFRQAEMTSSGLNGKPLAGLGVYEARTACSLWAESGTGRYDVKLPWLKYWKHPYFTQDGRERRNSHPAQYIANMRNGSAAGFKYFQMTGADEISIQIRGKGSGEMLVSEDREFRSINARIPFDVHGRRIRTFAGELEIGPGKKTLYFKVSGRGRIDFLAFGLAGK